MTAPTAKYEQVAELHLGRRDEDGPIGGILHEPFELGYRCPAHQRAPERELETLTLHWSEYTGFLWCSLCERDYPSALCCEDPVRATEVFLSTVSDAIERDRRRRS